MCKPLLTNAMGATDTALAAQPWPYTLPSLCPSIPSEDIRRNPPLRSSIYKMNEREKGRRARYHVCKVAYFEISRSYRCTSTLNAYIRGFVPPKDRTISPDKCMVSPCTYHSSGHMTRTASIREIQPRRPNQTYPGLVVDKLYVVPVTLPRQDTERGNQIEWVGGVGCLEYLVF